MYLDLSWCFYLIVKSEGFRESERGREKEAVMNLAKRRTKAVRAYIVDH